MIELPIWVVIGMVIVLAITISDALLVIAQRALINAQRRLIRALKREVRSQLRLINVYRDIHHIRFPQGK